MRKYKSKRVTLIALAAAISALIGVPAFATNPGSIVIIDTLVQANGQTYPLVNAQDVGGNGSTNILNTNTLPVFSSSALGAVPLSGGGTTNYLRADGTWAAPPGSASGTVTSFSAGTLSPLFTTSVATSTTTPALTFSLTNAAGGTLFGNNSGTSGAPAYTTAPVLGVNAATNGTLGLANGGALGTTITLQNLGNTTAYNFNFPTTAGAVGAILTSAGGASASNIWLSDVATGQILISGGTTTIPAFSATLPSAVQGNITSTGTVTSGTWSGSFGAVTGANLTNLTAANISAGTAGINISGNAATVTTNANLTGPITSSGNATSVAGAAAGKIYAGATPSFTATPTLGLSGTTGTLSLVGGTSGTAVITPQAAAGTPTITLGTSSGTPAVTASSPLAITTATGNITCATCNTSSATVSSVTFTGDGTVLSSTPSSAVTTTGTLTATLATQTANTVLGALTATTPSDLAVPSCSAAGNALKWTSGAGFGCATGFLTGNQTITLTGDTTGSGTTAITTTTTQLHGNTITNGDWCTSNGTIINCTAAIPVTAFTGDGVIISNSASTGSVTDTLVSQVKNTVLAGPTAGSNATPTMRVLVGADLPAPAATTLGGVESLAAVSHNFLTSISTSGAPTQAQPAFSDVSGQATNAQLATQTANTVLGALTATTPSGLSLPSCTDSVGNHLNYTSGIGFSCGTSDAYVGTVTSVTFTGDGIIDSSTPSTAVTTTGTVTATAITQAANKILAGPISGSAATPTFRALAITDEPAFTQAMQTSIAMASFGGL